MQINRSKNMEHTVIYCKYLITRRWLFKLDNFSRIYWFLILVEFGNFRRRPLLIFNLGMIYIEEL